MFMTHGNRKRSLVRFIFTFISLFNLKSHLARPSEIDVRQSLLIFWPTIFILLKINPVQNKNEYLLHILEFLIKIQFNIV